MSTTTIKELYWLRAHKDCYGCINVACQLWYPRQGSMLESCCRPSQLRLTTQTMIMRMRQTRQEGSFESIDSSAPRSTRASVKSSLLAWPGESDSLAATSCLMDSDQFAWAIKSGLFSLYSMLSNDEQKWHLGPQSQTPFFIFSVLSRSQHFRRLKRR